MEAIFISLLITVSELLIEVVQYVSTGKHNWLAISYAIMFGIFAIISAIFYITTKNERR